MYCGGKVPAPAGTPDSMPSDERETPGSDEQADVDESADDEAAGQPRDPETGKFLPSDERPAGDSSAESESESSRDDVTHNAESTSPTDTGDTRESPKEPPDESHERGLTALRGPSDPPASLGTVFVTHPEGYPRPRTMFLPTLPWLRLPARPPAHETVSRR